MKAYFMQINWQEIYFYNLNINIIKKIEKITIGIILYKNTKYLKKCLKSLLSQTHENFELLLRDQDEDCEASQYLKNNYPDLIKDSRVNLSVGKNLWHSAGHNLLFSQMSKNSDAYLCASNDILYEKDFLGKLVKTLNENLEYSIAVPKLKRWDFEYCLNENKNFGKTNFIDSCGIGLHENHHFFDIGQGKKDTGQYDNIKEIFGASGALFLARKSALEKVNFFDELIHYKNDIDLAYRLLWAGEKTCFVSDCVAFHDRQVCDNKSKPLWVKESSFFGHLVFLYKNVCCMHFPISVRIKIWWYMIRATVFLLITEPRVLLQYKKFFSVFSDLKQKKQKIIVTKKASVFNVLKFCK